MSLAARAPSPLPFDPFLRELEGAERVADLDGIRRAVDSMLGREVMLATDDGEVVVGRCHEPLCVRVPGDVPVEIGQTVSVTDHRDVQYVAFRAVVGAIQQEAGVRILRLFVPREAFFYPGRRHVRIDGVLGADLILEFDDQLTVARGVDVSMGGIGVRVAASDGFVIGKIFTVHMHFSDGPVSLPARVRTAVVAGDDVRLGLEFAARSEALERRVRSALLGLAPEA